VALDTRGAMVARERRHVSTRRRGGVRVGNCSRREGSGCAPGDARRGYARRTGANHQPDTKCPQKVVARRGYARARSAYSRRRRAGAASATADEPRLLVSMWKRARRGYARSALANPADASGPPHRRSSGLRTPSASRFRTCRYTIVVDTSAWPSSSCTVRMS